MAGWQVEVLASADAGKKSPCPMFLLCSSFRRGLRGPDQSRASTAVQLHVLLLVPFYGAVCDMQPRIHVNGITIL